MVVGDLHDELGAQRLPRQVFPLTPPTLSSRHARGFAVVRVLQVARPRAPRVAGERCLAVGGQLIDEGATFGGGEARAHADVLQRTVAVVEAEEKRADGLLVAPLVPAEPRHDAVAIPLVLDLEHHSLVRLVRSRGRLGDDAVEPRAFEAFEPVGGYGLDRWSPA